MGIEPTYQLVAGTTGLKPGEPTRCPSAPPFPRFGLVENFFLRIFNASQILVKQYHPKIAVHPEV